MERNRILNILRNPWGYSEAEKKEARLAAADLIEEQEKWGREILEWVEKQGIDTTVYV